jgi:hypothetical protein
MQVLSGDADTASGRSSGVVSEADATIFAPAQPEDFAARYDLSISHPDLHTPQFAAFDRWLARAAASHDLTCALIHDGNIAEARRRLDAGQMTIGYHLDYYALWHHPEDPYAQLAHAIEDTGGHSVNPPARARAFTDKATAVAELRRHGLGVPATLLLRPRAAPRSLTVAERNRLGLDAPDRYAYLKPANGFAGQGVVRIPATDEALAAALANARQHDPNETFLLQREIQPPLLACEDGVSRLAYWRVLYQHGEVLPFWWAPQERIGPEPSYRALTVAELHRHRLQAVLSYVRKVAELTGLDWFSTELCLSDGDEPSSRSVIGPDGRERPVLAIDPINDQCDVDVQSRWAGAAPDEVVRHIAARFAERAWQLRQRWLRPENFSYRAAA